MFEPRFRLRMRHPSHDCAGPGVWFITIDAFACRHLFGRVVGEYVELNDLGRIVEACWQQVPLHFPHVRPDRFVVMPNHMHAVLYLAAAAAISNDLQRIERFGAPVVGSMATIVRSFKAAATRSIREHVGEPLVVWQPRFYERRPHDHQALKNVRRYIELNPRRWTERSRSQHAADAVG